MSARFKYPMIAFAAHSSKDHIGGVTTWLQSLLKRLNNDGIPIVVFLLHYGSSVEESNLLHSLRQTGISVDIALYSSYVEDDVLSILAFLNRHKPQVFLPHCIESMYYSAIVAAKAGLPWAMTIHSDELDYWAYTEMLAPESNNGLIVGVSDYICEKAVQKGLANQPRAIPCGVPAFEDAVSFSDAPFRVAFSGRVVEEQKRISLVLDAMSKACLLDSRIECWIMGDGSDMATSRQWVNDQGLSDRIIFLGRLEPSAVQSKLALCHGILFMSDYEGLPVALLEAMAIGVVPIVRLIPSGIPELVKNNETGLLVDDTPEQAATAIVHLVNHPELWLKFSNASKSLVAENYSEEVCYQRWLNVISELSDRSTITYPIKIPKTIPIPPVHPDLLGRIKSRRPPTVNRIYENAYHAIMYARGFVIKLGFVLGRKILPKSFREQLWSKYGRFF